MGFSNAWGLRMKYNVSLRLVFMFEHVWLGMDLKTNFIKTHD